MNFEVILLLVIIAGFAGLFYFVRARTERKEDSSGLALLQQQLQELNRTVDSKLSDSAKTLFSQTSEIQKSMHGIIKDVTEQLTKVGEGQRQVMDFTEQLQDLQDILKNPKQRGILGEYYLETLLKNVLPPGSFQMQYAFKDGDIVDAAVFVKDKVIPVDSKFSLENYNRIVEERNESERAKLEKIFVNDLKNRIVETSKYIRPNEGTMEFAFMFIPHEAIYYDLLINKIGALKDEETENLIQRAASKYKVIIVSPTSFLAYLQTVLQGLKAMQIEETAKDIIVRVNDLGRHLKSYETAHTKVGTHLSTVINAYNTSSKELKKIDKDVLKLGGEGMELELDALEKPQQLDD